MADSLEKMVMAEAKRQGVVPNESVIRQAVTDLCGASLTDAGLIKMPGRGAISPKDFVTSLRTYAPQNFIPVQSNGDQPAKLERRAGESMTDHMRRVKEAERKQPAANDWEARRQCSTGLTRKMMDHIATNRRA